MAGAAVLASVKVALPRVDALTPSTPPAAVAALLPVRAASPTVAVPVMTVVWRPSSVTVMVKS